MKAVAFCNGFFIIFEYQNQKVMKKYLVIKGFYKLSDKKTYSIGDTIELSDEESEAKITEGLIADETFGITTKKTIEEVDKEIKKANKKIK